MPAKAQSTAEKSTTAPARQQPKSAPEQSPAQHEINPLWHRMSAHTADSVAASGSDSDNGSSGIQTKPKTPVTPTLVQRMSAEWDQEQQDEATTIQTQLTIGAPDDPYEQEADTVADTVMRSSTTSSVGEEDGPIQAKAIQRKALGISPVQRLFSELNQEKEGNLQKKEGGGAQSISSKQVKNTIISPGSGAPVNEAVRQRIEPVLGADLSGVRVHTDQPAQQAANDINARAFTNKNNIFLGANQSSNDVALMAHEATHTVQQGATQTVRRDPIENADEHDDISQESEQSEGEFDLSGLMEALTPDNVERVIWVSSDNPSIQYADPRLSKRDLASIWFDDEERYMDIAAVDSNLYETKKPGFLTYRMLSTEGISAVTRDLIEEKVVDAINRDLDILHNMSQEWSWTGNDSSKVVYTIIKWAQMAHLKDINGLSYFDRFLKTIDGGSYDGGSKTLLKDLYDDLDKKYQQRIAAALRFSSNVYNTDSRFDFAAIDRVVEDGITRGAVIGRFYNRENYASYRIYVQVVQLEGSSFDQVDFEMRNSPVYMASRMSGATSAHLGRNRAVVPYGGKFYGVSLITDQEGYSGGFDWETSPYEMELIWYHKGTKLIRNERYNPEYDTTKPVSPANVTLIKDMIEERQGLLLSGSIDIGDYVALFTFDYDALNAIGPGSRKDLMDVIFQALSLSSGSNRGLYKYFFRTLQRVMSVMSAGELESFVAWLRTKQYVDKIIDWSRIIESDPEVDTSLIVGQLIVAGFHMQEDFQNEPLVLDDTYTFKLGSKANSSNDLFFHYVHADTTIGADGKEYITLKQYREEEGLFGSNTSPSSPNYTSAAILPTTMVPVRITFTDEDGNEIQNQEMIISAFELAVFGQTLTEVIQAGKFRMDMMIFGINLIFILFLLSGIGALLRLLATVPLRLLLRQGALVFIKEIGKKLVSQKAKSIFVRIIIDTIFVGIEQNRAALQRTEDGRTFLSIYHVLLMTLIAGMGVKFLLSTGLMNRLIVYGARVLPTISKLAARAGMKTTLADIAAMSKAAGRMAPELATAGGPQLTAAMETSFMVAFREERVAAGRDLVLSNVGGTAAVPATKTALTKLYTELESAAATDAVRSKVAVNITRALEQMSATEVAAFLPKAGQLLKLYPAVGGDLLVLNFFKAAVKSSTPSLFLDDVLLLAARGLNREALRGIAFKLAIRKPVLTLEWLLRGKGKNIPLDQMNLIGADKYTKWGTLMNPAAVDFASTIRGIGGELVAIKGGIFRGYTIFATQVKAGKSLLDVIYQRISTGAKKAVEVKSWNLVRWKKNLRQYDRLMRGESLTKVELREANQIKTLLKQLEDAAVATSAHEKPALVLSDVIKGENMQLAGSTAKIRVTKQLNSVLARDLPGTSVQLKYIKESAIRAERDILEAALR